MTAPLYLFDPDRDGVPVSSDELHAGWNLTLPPTLKRHAIQAMRLSQGDELQLSDGKGLRIHGIVVDSEGGLAQVREFGREPEPLIRLALIQALAKGGHDEQAIDMATQLGADEVVPWQSRRSIAKWKEGRTDRKWRQVLESATEQSRRAWVPKLSDCVSDAGIVAICRRACVHGDLVIVLHQDATASWDDIDGTVDGLTQRTFDDGRPRTISVVVGPEGGIGDEEVERFVSAGAFSCTLGGNILRASTAGPAALSLLARAIGRFA